MPEVLEFLTDGLHIAHFVNTTPAENRILQHIHGDATAKEMQESLPGSRPAAGHVYEFNSSSIVKRGGAVKAEKKTPVFPAKYASGPDTPLVPISAHALRLVTVKTAPRAIILEFKELNGEGPSYWCQVQLFTHTNVQIFTLDEWSEAVCKIDRKARGFKVGLALEFRTHVLAFLTLDLLIQVYWSEKLELLPPSPADIVTEYPQFIKELVEWIQERRAMNSTRNGIAMNLIRAETSIFCGAGVYTIQEVFHRAGLSPNLAEFEIFDCPSRTARLIASYYHYCLNARQRAWPFIRPFVHGYLRACRREDRALYAHELLVHGKDRTNFSARFKDLLKMFNSCLESHLVSNERWTRVHGKTDVPYDVFEPDLIRSALECKDLCLGPLIFGESQWSRLAADNNLVASAGNVLSEYFSGQEFDHSKTWLHPDYYDYLFSPTVGRQGMTAWSHTKLYRWSKTFVWSVIPVYPLSSLPDLSASCPRLVPANQKKALAKKKITAKESRVKIEMCDAETRESRLLKNATQHSEVYTVGPLDFCGVAQIVSGPGGTDVIMVCRMDPRQSMYCIERHVLGAATAKLKGKGLEKKGIDSKVKKSLLRKIPKRKLENDKENQLEHRPLMLPTPPPSSPISEPRPSKRRRRSADRDILAQSDQNSMDSMDYLSRNFRSLTRSTSVWSSSSPAPVFE